MRKVYVISRYKAKTRRERRFNQQVAAYFCKHIAAEGNRPVAPHLFYTDFLNDDDPEERSAGLAFGIADLDECDEFLCVVVDNKISEGMAGELTHIARQGSKPGHMVHLTRKQAKQLVKEVKR